MKVQKQLQEQLHVMLEVEGLRRYRWWWRSSLGGKRSMRKRCRYGAGDSVVAGTGAGASGGAVQGKLAEVEVLRKCRCRESAGAQVHWQWHYIGSGGAGAGKVAIEVKKQVEITT